MAAADRRPLALLCAVEFCERFAGYVLLALFVLYLDERVGLPASEAARVAGYVTALAYAACIAGGFFADRWLGPRRAVASGICALGLSYAAVALDVRARLLPAAARPE